MHRICRHQLSSEKDRGSAWSTCLEKCRTPVHGLVHFIIVCIILLAHGQSVNLSLSLECLCNAVPGGDGLDHRTSGPLDQGTVAL